MKKLCTQAIALLLLCMACMQGQAQIITTIAGNPSATALGDGGPATAASLNSNFGASRFYEGYLYIADQYDYRIRRVDPYTGIISTICGNGTPGYSGDGGPASAAMVYCPCYIVFDNAGNLYFNDFYNYRVRKIDAVTGIITTVAGNGIMSSTGTGDGGPATAAEFGYLDGLFIDAYNNIFISDRLTSTIRKVDAATGIVHLVAGNGSAGFSGDGGPATNAQLYYPGGLCTDPIGNLYIADIINYRIRKVDTAGIITTFAGTGAWTWSGDGGPATAAALNQPEDIITNGSGYFYEVEAMSNTVRMIDPSGSIFTIAGSAHMPPGFSGDGGAPLAAQLNTPTNIAFDCAGNLIISDYGNNAVRLVNYFHNHKPHFTGGATQSLTVCIASGGYPLNSILSAIDTDAGQSEWWEVRTAPPHGTLGGFVYSAVSSGGIMTPAGLTYTPATGYTGTDTFQIGIVDCAGNTDLTTIYVTVTASPPPISGAGSVCVGGSTTLSISGSPSGTWSSSASSIANVVHTSGVVTGISAGIATISFTSAGGCISLKTMTVTAIPDITGITAICNGTTTTLSDTYPGGLWTSGNAAVATVGSASGVVSGVSIGTATITYRLPSGCYATATVTVSGVAPISGTLTVCPGSTTALSDTGSGTWSSSSPSVATAGSSTGVVTGVAAGTATITYRLPATGCYSMAVVTVNPLPAAITGTLNVCMGGTTALSDATGGGLWTSGNPAVAMIGSSYGIITSVATGIANITYALPTGCSVVAPVTVNPLPAPVTGYGSICAGATVTLSDATAGGIWLSGAPSVATVGSATGIVSGISGGTAAITYMLPTGCLSAATVTINPLPASISGGPNVCLGAPVTLRDATGGGIWTSSSTAVVTIGSASGIATGVASGTATITYTLPTGCSVTTPVTVNPLPSAITGTGSICGGATLTLSDTTGGGTWVSGTTSIATVGSSSGLVTGVTGGTATISYVLATGCYTTTSVTVLATPSPIIGSTYICTGHPASLGETTGGGTWSSSDITKATVSPSTGSPVTVTEVSAGTATISYTLPSTGCFVTVTVGELPPISGLRSMCPWGEDSITITDAPVTGALYSSLLVTVTNLGGGAGEVRAYAPGVDTIFYTIPSGCSVYGLVTVNPLPGPITGIMHVCIGATTTLSDGATGGTWTTSAPAIATVGLTTGIVTGVATGTARITYTLPTGCWTDTPVVVNPAPTVISGSGFLCVGSTVTLTDSVSGGTWSSSNPAIASVGSTGIVTGISVGTATITYMLCSTPVILTVTVSSLPAIAGASAVCIGGTDTLTDADAGGIWSSSNPAIGSVSSSGIVTGISAGTVTISYGLSTGCVITRTITVTSGSGGCVPCSVFRSYSPLGTSGHITGNVGAGNYYIANNVTVTGNDTFTNAIVLIAPGDTVFVDTSSLLVLDSSHLFSLCSEWAGMAMKPGRTHSGRLYVVGNSMVEDAMCAVYIPNAVTPASATDYIFKSEASTFNRNVCGLFIQHYNPAITNYPFLIRNTVFTSRDFQTTNPRFPYYWPPTYGAGGLKNYWHPTDTFSTPLNIDNPHPNPTYTGFSYPGVSCYGGLIPANGIRLDSVGTNDIAGETGFNIPGHYYEMVVGDVTVTDNNQNANLFDALNFAIYSINSNLTCVNNVFADLFPNPAATSAAGTAPVVGGDGVYCITTNDVANQNRLRVYTPAGSTYGNRWYNFNIGIEASNMFELIGQKTYMMNKGFGSAKTGPMGSAGYAIKTAKYNNIEISYDTITNVSNGVAIWMAYDPTVWLSIPTGSGGYLTAIPSQYMGNCNISYNLIQAHPDWTASLTTQQVLNGIAYQNPYAYRPPTFLGPVVTTANNLNIRSNMIHDAYNGIYVNNYAAPRTYQPIALENSISVRHWTRRTLQFGVNYTNCNNGYVYWNTVTGTDTTVAPASDSMRAFYAANNNLIDIGCNHESYIGRGFDFFTNNALTNWHDNHMQNNGKGFVLSGAVIGPQYHGGTTSAPLPMNDYWDGSWGGSNYQTWVKSAHAPSSAFYINAAPPSKNPTNNSGDPYSTSALFDLYGSPSSINIVTAFAGPCVTPLSPMTSDTSNLFSLIAQQHVNYVYNFVPRSWMAQYELWKSITLDSTLVDSSATVAEFSVLAQHSRYKYLTDIEQALNDGDITTASTMLGYDIDSLTNTSWDTVSQVRMADDSSMDYIVQNYQQYFSLYISYATMSMSGHDSVNLLALASLCPEVNGAVVYQARALYSLVYNDLSMFNDDSCLSVDSTYFASRHSGQNNTHPQTITAPQGYKLYPNPNSGSFTLQQYIPDDKPVKVVIYDMMGRTAYDNSLQFSYAHASLTTSNYPSGMYLIEITDSKNQTFRVKFVISK